MTSAVIFVASIYGRQVARKNFFPHAIFSANIVCLPLFYLVAFHYLYIDKRFMVYKKNPTFNDLLEHYPVTRRAWKRALIIREQEMNKIKSSLSA